MTVAGVAGLAPAVAGAARAPRPASSPCCDVFATPPIWITDFPGTLTPVEETGTVGTPIQATSGAYDVVLTPNGRKAYVSRRYSTNNTRAIVPVDLTTGTAGRAIPIPGTEVAMAAGPGGKTVYLTTDNGILVLIDTATDKVRSQLAMEGRTPDLAILPNGATAFVIVDDGVVPVDTRTLKPSHRIAVTNGLQSLSISPDGATVYAAAGDQLTAISTAPDTGDPVAQLGGTASSVAVTPDGTVALTAVGSTVVPFAVAGLQARTPVQVGADPLSIVTTGDAILVPHSDAHAISTLVWSPSGSVTASRDLTIPGEVNALAATADQAPVARLAVTVAPAGRATRLDPTASTTRYGYVETYKWNFGDGTKATIDAAPWLPPATIRHTYAKPGRYTVSVTAVNTQGTSTAKAYTGHAMVVNGGPRAVATKTIVVPRG